MRGYIYDTEGLISDVAKVPIYEDVRGLRYSPWQVEVLRLSVSSKVRFRIDGPGFTCSGNVDVGNVKVGEMITVVPPIGDCFDIKCDL